MVWQSKNNISELQFATCPTPSTFICWKTNFKTEVCSGSRYYSKAMCWVEETEMATGVDQRETSRNIWRREFPNFEIARALKKKIPEFEFNKGSPLRWPEGSKENRFFCGSQIAKTISEYVWWQAHSWGCYWFLRWCWKAQRMPQSWGKKRGKDHLLLKNKTIARSWRVLFWSSTLNACVFLWLRIPRLTRRKRSTRISGSWWVWSSNPSTPSEKFSPRVDLESFRCRRWDQERVYHRSLEKIEVQPNFFIVLLQTRRIRPSRTQVVLCAEVALNSLQIVETNDDYRKFCEQCRKYLKLGIHEDSKNRAKIAGMLRNPHFKVWWWKDQIERNSLEHTGEGQNVFYRIIGESIAVVWTCGLMCWATV